METEIQGAFHCPADRPADINRSDVIIPPQLLKKWPVDEISFSAAT